MCGIIGYLGLKPVSDVLLNGLQRLEYRGYDSAGMATICCDKMEVRRQAGKVSALGKDLATRPLEGSPGIAHTRWATHGRPTESNAHPHLDASERIALVHNGIIENHDAIRSFLEGEGVLFKSETDTEALVQLIGYFYAQGGDLIESVRRALRDVIGTYGVAILCLDCPNTLVAARRGSPLIVGIGEGEYLVASDGTAIVEHTSQVVYLHDNELVLLDGDGMHVSTIDAEPVHKDVDVLEMTLGELELGAYPHHMLKEIFEQPEALRDTMRGRVDAISSSIRLGGLDSVEREWNDCRRLILAGCGTAWHAALIGEYLFEELARIPTEVEYASELRYRNPIVGEGTVAVFISQSGETADTLAALHEMRTKGATVLGIVNAVGSTIARETDAGVYLHVGAEIGVASTKAFTGQLATLAMMAVDIGRHRHLSAERTSEIIAELSAIPEKIEQALELGDEVKNLVARFADRDNWLFLGRGVNYPVAIEGALKLKEISYIHAEGLPAAEMKHGPLALIDEDMPVVVVAPRDHTYEKVLANIEEVCGRQGQVIALATEKDVRLERIAAEVMYVPSTLPMLSPLVTSVPLQLLAYHAAVYRGHDVDKPRNLAKSVTVE
jgi:glucosamine--fructose-6-phosphate aminotransferase (isomerizing)